MFTLFLLTGNFDLLKFLAHVRGAAGPLKCGGPCSAEHVRTFLNPTVELWDST